ncbi:bifunctional [glutamine synthetase] adenylyltransferase/[glutamine synthetase]-adenylyl-L-tyrosine phosphorylase [Actinospica durhamensis]|uniref:Bifunctional glutamine synthetase adenylyltransferase/adenylyl-removing enzyme n=1 Tax=Actinospica durhamensis TaxID=1508375 RepID=A0A941EV10_9ACTN|nr:bifunctional [glutamine synthetase] adenylyltransferase/[glutamine synthetase]-adenylyl-L-tyrosine phosphorylase [Actinospica durhamensis]MBR7837758.1 bifunctional [glutamine synthetase] adenylyltransferase/[glutamine synthetase]-adenylyl-L-tyrosine phosphorylase [Actinospica durhamensis]
MAVQRERESQLSRLARRGFADPEAAAGRLATPAFDGLAADPVFLESLGRCADPDTALGSLARLLEALPHEQAEMLRATLAASQPLRGRLFGVLGVSEALGDFLARHPEAWHELDEFDVDELISDPDYLRGGLLRAVGADPASAEPQAALTGAEAADALRVAYRRGLLRVTAMDVSGGAAMSKVGRQLADLAGATLEAALAVARAELPADAAPCRLAVIGMGKCGARELNYVSDVDVIFVAAPGQGADGTPVDEYEALRTGTRLAAALMRICGEVTAEGSIWQVDAALRPEGKSGPLVRTLASHVAYYHRWAKTWEFQALLKARPIAGDHELGEAYLAAVSSLIWSAVERDHFVEDVRAMRRRVVDHAAAALRAAPGAGSAAGAAQGVAVERELKLGPGGLRDIEFAIQLLQLVHGRGDDTLRRRGTLEALEALAVGGYVGRADAQQLGEAYRFLRTVEHRIQLFRLERTHLMPTDPASLRRIGRSLGFASDPAGQLRLTWQAHVRVVRQLHEKLFYRPLLSTVARLDATAVRLPAATGVGTSTALPAADAGRLSVAAARSRLTALGYADPAGALANIEALTTGLSRRAAIQRTLLPVFLGWFGDAADPDASLLAFRRLSDALGSTPWYLRSLRDEGETAWRLARLLASGGFLTDLLMRAPDAVAQLSERRIRLPAREALATELSALVRRASDAAQAVTAVRAVRRRELLRIAAADVLGQFEDAVAEAGAGPRSAPAPDAAAVLRHPADVRIDAIGRALTDITAATVQGALEAVLAFRPDHDAPSMRFAVIAMGRFGGAELGYGSDADVLFVYEPMPDAQEQAAASAAFAVATELRALLQTPSTDPPLLIDADLRPEGRQGPLARTLASYTAYYRRWSTGWEAQALLRAAPVAGDAQLAARFIAAVDPLRYPESGPVEAEVREIRTLKARMESERLPRGADRMLHTKLGPGGLSDIEWVAQLLQLRHGAAHPALRSTGTRATLAAAAQAGLLDVEDAELLDEAWTHTSLLRNGITIVRGRPGDQVPADARELAGIASYLGEDVDSETLLDNHRRRARRARATFERLFYDEE